MDGPQIAYDAGVGRYLLTVAHGRGGGRIGVFEAPEPWGPWRTVTTRTAGSASAGGELSRDRAADPLDGRRRSHVWAVFSCYGRGACGRYHDRLNLMQATLTLRRQ